MDAMLLQSYKSVGRKATPVSRDPNFNSYSFNPPVLYDQRGSGFPVLLTVGLTLAFESQPR
jgi:hypothetical protein